MHYVCDGIFEKIKNKIVTNLQKSNKQWFFSVSSHLFVVGSLTSLDVPVKQLFFWLSKNFTLNFVVKLYFHAD